ncbi:MAG: hypothetical protein JJ896_16095 [Rhodothermales bacterium]|nr:hypothetical protein [Rhodothermales bacterium]MBO6781177.1 hypothetical protein [Rhodothermales bacterium]
MAVRDTSRSDGRTLVSFLTLRRVVGALGVLLPIVLVLGSNALDPQPGLQESISDYYGTAMRDVFVGVLFAIGWFLFSYRGYDVRDDLAGDLACLFAMGVALFPTTSADPAIRNVHFASAALLFLVLAYFSLYLFTKSRVGTPMTREKRLRNRVYRICGVLMLLCIALIAVYKWGFEDTALAHWKPVFWLESIALWAFGWSWFVKGETVLTDDGVDWVPLNRI